MHENYYCRITKCIPIFHLAYTTPAPIRTTAAPIYTTSAPVYSSSVLPPVRQPKYGSKIYRGKRETDPNSFVPDPWPTADPWPEHPGIDKTFDHIAKHSGYHGYEYTTEAPHIKCHYKPTKNCTEKVTEICEPKEKEIEDEICIEVPTQKADKVPYKVQFAMQ